MSQGSLRNYLLGVAIHEAIERLGAAVREREGIIVLDEAHHLPSADFKAMEERTARAPGRGDNQAAIDVSPPTLEDAAGPLRPMNRRARRADRAQRRRRGHRKMKPKH